MDQTLSQVPTDTEPYSDEDELTDLLLRVHALMEALADRRLPSALHTEVRSVLVAVAHQIDITDHWLH